MSNKKNVATEENTNNVVKVSFPSEASVSTEMVKIGGQTYEVQIKTRLTVEEKIALVDSVEEAYFTDGKYDSSKGDLVIAYMLMKYYTNLDFGGDMEAFDAFYVSDEYFILEHMMPKDYERVVVAINDKLDFLKAKNTTPIEELMLLDTLDEVATKAGNVLENIGAFLDQMKKAVGDDADLNIKDIFSALSSIGQKDEQKIVNAILDYQLEKDKKAHEAWVAAGCPVDTTIKTAKKE